ncbi:uncharacterized protein TNCV_617631 [Trichonephila clavipes]|nr:uncharacterized protein TNCV_617631 [Trichonephila clavipes]
MCCSEKLIQPIVVGDVHQGNLERRLTSVVVHIQLENDAVNVIYNCSINQIINISKQYDSRDDLQSSMDSLRINLGQNLHGSSLERRGFWTLKCSDQDVDSSGLTETDNVWKVLNNLYEETPEMFQFPPSQWNSSRNGYAMIKCHTPTDSDEHFILKIANIIREKIDFPYPMYYFSKDNMDKYVTTYLHTPNGEFYKKEDKAWVYEC